MYVYFTGSRVQIADAYMYGTRTVSVLRKHTPNVWDLRATIAH